MTIVEMSKRLSLTPLSLPDADRSFSGVYIGDLLSWVMGRAKSGCLWITIMSNINVVAVASLADVAAVILAEGVMPDAQMQKAAEERGVNVFSSELTAYELAVRLAELA